MEVEPPKKIGGRRRREGGRGTLSSAEVLKLFTQRGGVQKHFFDRDACPRTNFNYPKNRMTLNSNPKKIECPKIKTQKNRMNQVAMVVKV